MSSTFAYYVIVLVHFGTTATQGGTTSPTLGQLVSLAQAVDSALNDDADSGVRQAASVTVTDLTPATLQTMLTHGSLAVCASEAHTVARAQCHASLPHCIRCLQGSHSATSL